MVIRVYHPQKLESWPSKVSEVATSEKQDQLTEKYPHDAESKPMKHQYLVGSFNPFEKILVKLDYFPK